jgi:receptor protein-tyrosine kinase
MSLIEQAAKRLEELRRAGAETGDAASSPMVDTPVALRLPTPEAMMRAVEAAGATRAKEQRRFAPARNEATEDTAVADRAEIDIKRLKEMGFVTPDEPKSQIADEFRLIKRPIIRNTLAAVKPKNANLIMVTSALPGEGKTFTAINLAMSIAMEYNNTVLLVDGDVAHPGLPELLGVQQEPGLLDLLTRDDIDFGEALVKTNVDKLTVLPAGTRHRRATELLASEQMASLLRELAARYHDRIIIFDSPPLLPTTEARVLATHMGQIVMVVAADTTTHHQVNLALAAIESCEIVLMMLNKASSTDVGTYYGYYADDATP